MSAAISRSASDFAITGLMKRGRPMIPSVSDPLWLGISTRKRWLNRSKSKKEVNRRTKNITMNVILRRGESPARSRKIGHPFMSAFIFPENCLDGSSTVQNLKEKENTSMDEKISTMRIFEFDACLSETSIARVPDVVTDSSERASKALRSLLQQIQQQVRS